MLYGPYVKSLKGWDSNRDGLPHPNYHLDWDSWSHKIEILQESQPTLRFAMLYIDAMEVSVCNGRVIQCCIDPISSL